MAKNQSGRGRGTSTGTGTGTGTGRGRGRTVKKVSPSLMIKENQESKRRVYTPAKQPRLV